LTKQITINILISHVMKISSPSNDKK